MGTKLELKKILRLVQLGKLKPVVDSTFRLRDAARAQKKMLDRKQFGKIVLEV